MSPYSPIRKGPIRVVRAGEPPRYSMLRGGSAAWAALLALVIAAVALSAIWTGVQKSGEKPNGKSPLISKRTAPTSQTLPSPANSVNPARSVNPAKSATVQIRPGRVPRVLTGEVDGAGQPVAVACATCHATRPPNPSIQSSEALDEFHLGLTFRHGNSACLSCHNPDDYDSLRLANGTRIEFTDVMQLCAQCHGPQYRDYLAGAHGGMNGYWDLRQGPRTRNNCIDCHDPHAPQLPHMLPQFKPRDRFLEPEHPHGENDDE